MAFDGLNSIRRKLLGARPQSEATAKADATEGASSSSRTDEQTLTQAESKSSKSEKDTSTDLPPISFDERVSGRLTRRKLRRLKRRLAKKIGIPAAKVVVRRILSANATDATPVEPRLVDAASDSTDE